MYKIMKENGDVFGESTTLIHISLGKNGAYQECSSEVADGFCVKLPVTYIMDSEKITELADKVFCLPNHILHGNEPIAKYE